MRLTLGECCFGGSSISFWIVTNHCRFVKSAKFCSIADMRIKRLSRIKFSKIFLRLTIPGKSHRLPFSCCK